MTKQERLEAFQTAYKAAHNIPLAASEVVERRTRTTKTFRLPDGQFQTIIHGKSIHYETMEGSGEWLDITLNVEPSERAGYDWQVADNRFKYYFKSNYDQSYPVLANYKGHDLYQKIAAVCHYDPDTDTITILQRAQPTTLVIDGHHLKYNGIFKGIDLEHVVDTDFCRGFLHISVAGKQALKNAIQQQGLNPEGWMFFATKLDLDNYGLDPDVIMGHDYERRIRWKDAANKILHWFVPDVARDEAGNEQPCRLRIQNHPALGWSLFTALPLSWLKDSMGTVTIDPPTDYYGETADGYIYGYHASSYSTARATSSACDNAETTAVSGQTWTGSNYVVYRGFCSFPTADIPDDATILNATLYICAGFDNSLTNFNVQVYRAINAADAWVEPLCDNREANYDGAYDGTKTLEGTLRNTADGWVNGTYYSMAVATAGINKTGDTKYILVSDRDVAGTTPSEGEWVRWRSADYADTSSDPYLAVTYVEATTSTSTTTTSTSSTTTTSTSTTTTTTSTSSSTTTSTSTSTTSTSSSTTTSTSSSSTTSTSSSTTTSSSTSTTTTTSSSTSSSTTTTSSTSTSSSTTTTLPTSGGLAFGEQNPTQGESAVSWVTWSDGAGGAPTIVGDANWGKIELSSGDKGHSGVYDFGDATNRYHTIIENRYGTGQGTATIYIRGQVATFNQDDADPIWEEYTGGIWKTWRWIQVKLTGPVD